MNIECITKQLKTSQGQTSLCFGQAWAYSRRLHERHQVTVFLDAFEMFWAGPGLGRGLLGWFGVLLSFRCF